MAKKTSTPRKKSKKAPRTKRAGRPKKTATKRAKVKVDDLSLKDITSLEQELQKAKAQVRDRERKALKAKIDKILIGSGFTIFEIYGVASKKRGKSVSVARYANPDDPSDTWTGRGRKPNWVLAQLKKGKDLEEFAI